MGRPGVGDPRLREPKTKSKMKQKGASGYAGGSFFTVVSRLERLPDPPMRAVSSSIRSRGKGGRVRGFRAMDMSFMGLSSAATRLEWRTPAPLATVDDGPLAAFAHPDTHWLHDAAASAARSPARRPGEAVRQLGQWLRCSPPVGPGVTRRPHTLQVKLSWQGASCNSLFECFAFIFPVHGMGPPKSICRFREALSETPGTDLPVSGQTPNYTSASKDTTSFLFSWYAALRRYDDSTHREKSQPGQRQRVPKGGRRRDFLQIVWIWVDKRAEKMDDGGANCTGAEERRRFR